MTAFDLFALLALVSIGGIVIAIATSTDKPTVSPAHPRASDLTELQRRSIDLAERRAKRQKAVSDALEEFKASVPELLDKVRGAYESDVAQYSFSCRRSGDFVILNNSRRGVTETKAINLTDVARVDLDLGEPWSADQGRAVITEYGTYIEDRSAAFGPFTGPQRCRYLTIYNQLPRSYGGRGFYDDTQPHNESVDSLPTYATDDFIIFTGLDLVLTAPQGHGAATHQSIMDAIASGPSYRRPEKKGVPA